MSVAPALPMPQILAYRPPHARSEATARLGMSLFLGSWAMMFSALFFAYGMVRSRAAVWPPAGSVPLPFKLGAFNTAIIAVSSVCFHLALVQARRGRLAGVAPAIGASLIAGLSFLDLQVRSWMGIAAAGMKPTDGPFASVFYGLTWLHAVHVAVGLVAMSWLLVQAMRGRYLPARHLPLKLWSMYWHFVGVVWLVLFVTVYAL